MTLLRALSAMSLLAVSAWGSADAGPWRASERNTHGWAFMTPQERIAHQATVRGFTEAEACRAYQARHHALIEARARAAGQTLPPRHRDLCAHLPSPGASAPAASPRPTPRVP